LKIKSISIEKLFGQFDYTIPFNDEGITILTGPNGYGKTTILNIVNNLSDLNFWHFGKIKYDNVSVEYDDGYTLNIFPSAGGNAVHTTANLDDLKKKYSNKVYYIKDQRLQSLPNGNQDSSKADDVSTKTVEKYAKDLADILNQKKQEETTLSEKLTTTQFNRIKDCVPLDEKEYKERFEAFLEKYHQLEMLGIYSEPLKYADYTENRQYLTVFLEDFEQRINLYNEVIMKASLFKNMMDEKELTHKKITINKDIGFSILTDAGQELKLSYLSSGEQQEIIFLYEFLFKVTEDSLVLIDEPETSMHIEWQRQFIPDLKKIRQVNNNLSFLIATHSPQIIGSDWDLTVDLFDLSKGNDKNA
jgi:predicted ATP-binding protein involved in virulence